MSQIWIGKKTDNKFSLYYDELNSLLSVGARFIRRNQKSGENYLTEILYRGQIFTSCDSFPFLFDKEHYRKKRMLMRYENAVNN